MVHTSFDLGHMLGVSVGRLLIASAFEYYSGVPGTPPSAQNSPVFVASMNVSYMAAAALGLIPVATSFTRGGGRIQAAAGKQAR